jgi:hypothetical protein
VPPLGRVVVGYLLVLIDLRLSGLDVIPDMAGWVFLLIGLGPLLSRHGWFQLAGAAAALELVMSLFELLQAPTGLAVLVDSLASAALVFGICSGVIAVVSRPQVRATADRIRWISLAIGLVAALFTVPTGTTSVDGPVALLVVLFVVVALGVMIWFLVFCWKQRGLPELT